MYIINKYGVFHSIPDDWPLPAGARKATKAEIDEWKKQDGEAKAARRAQKEQTRRERAQLVVNVKPEDKQ